MSKKIESGRILIAAIFVAERDGFNNINREEIARKAGVSTGVVSQAFGTMIKLKRTVMRHAIQDENIEIIAAGLGVRDKTAMKAPDELKRRALDHLYDSTF